MNRFPPQEECNKCGAIIGTFGGCACNDDTDEKNWQEMMLEDEKHDDCETDS
jgi:hypothetical protein